MQEPMLTADCGQLYWLWRLDSSSHHREFADLIRKTCCLFQSLEHTNLIKQGDMIESLLWILRPWTANFRELREQVMNPAFSEAVYQDACDVLERCVAHARALHDGLIFLIADAFFPGEGSYLGYSVSSGSR